MHNMLAALRLVHAPISNQLADKLLDHSPNIQDITRNANVYMIGVRKQARFEDFLYDEVRGILTCKIVFEGIEVRVQINAGAIADAASDMVQTHFGLRANEGTIDLYENYQDDQIKVFAWFTPDKVLYLHSRGYSKIVVTGDYSQIMRFELLYIGMSNDSAYRRLVGQTHHARLKILTNELCRGVEGRLSEEVMFFFFDVQPVVISQYKEHEDIDDTAVRMMIDFEDVIPQSQVILDVEKAFIKVLDTKYNKRKYASYPSIKGGLNESVLDSYVYYIDEDLQFDVGQFTFSGACDPIFGVSEAADYIAVRKSGTVEFEDVSRGTTIVIA